RIRPLCDRSADCIHPQQAASRRTTATICYEGAARSRRSRIREHSRDGRSRSHGWRGRGKLYNPAAPKETISCNPVAPAAISDLQTVQRNVQESSRILVFRKELLTNHRLLSGSVSESGQRRGTQ